MADERNGSGTHEGAELEALQRIDETALELQRRGEYLKALEVMERGLVLRQHFFGADSDEVWLTAKRVGEMCNLLAMTYLQQEDFKMVLELLKKAEILSEHDDTSRAVTYNNFACYYRRKGKLHAALQYLQKTLKIESRIDEVKNPADTHLNIHAQALEHANTALILLQEEIFAPVDGAPPTEADLMAKVDRLAVLAIAYHNLGVEQEHLHKYSSTLQTYRKGVELARRYLGDTHGITVTLRNSFLAARRSLAQRGTVPRAGGATGAASTGTLRSTGGGGGGGGGGGRASRASAASPPGAAATGPRGAAVTERDEKRFNSIASAYGNPDGVVPVRRTGSGSGGVGASTAKAPTQPAAPAASTRTRLPPINQGAAASPASPAPPARAPDGRSASGGGSRGGVGGHPLEQLIARREGDDDDAGALEDDSRAV